MTCATKEKFGSNQHATFRKEFEQLARNEKSRYANTFIYKNTISSVKCWRCNFLGHIVKYYHTIRCYVCDKYGHKTSQCFMKVQQ